MGFGPKDITRLEKRPVLMGLGARAGALTGLAIARAKTPPRGALSMVPEEGNTGGYIIPWAVGIRASAGWEFALARLGDSFFSNLLFFGTKHYPTPGWAVTQYFLPEGGWAN